MSAETGVGGAGRCRSLTAAGRPCRRRAGEDGFCGQHTRAAFYARVLSGKDRASYLQALDQEGLAAEVALLRLHLLRLVGRGDPEKDSEIPRTVHALARALKDDRAAADTLLDALDAAVRAEGRRLLGTAETGRAED